MKNILTKTKSLIFFTFLLIIMAASVKGVPGNPMSNGINSRYWIQDGPFELSNERGRFALIYSVIENHSFQFSIPLARFSTPDVGYTNGQYVSLFAPGVSFLVIPGYLIGKLFGLSQFGAFMQIALFAILNVYLIKKIAIQLGVSPLPALLGGLIFLFATPAYAYGTTLYQHHISTFLLLCNIWLLLRYNTMTSLLLIWLLTATAAVVDYPNGFMSIPIALAALGKYFFIAKDTQTIRISFLYPRIYAFIGLLLPVVFLVYFNQMSFKNPFQISGGVANVDYIDANGMPTTKPPDENQITQQQDFEAKQQVVSFFKTRNIVNGLSVQFFSLDRGMLIYTPVILFGFLGIYLAVRQKVKNISLLISVCGINILLYAMWGDPHGGWAFGSRYLIPSYAILAIFIAYLLHQWRDKVVFLGIFFVVLCYSVSVSTLGALTSNSNPPKKEAILLENRYKQKQLYTYERNINLLNNNVSKSFVFQTYAKQHISAWQYYSLILGTILLPFLILFSLLTDVKKTPNFSLKIRKSLLGKRAMLPIINDTI